MIATGPGARKRYETFRMFALGQKQTFAMQTVMSALPPKADMCGATQGCPLCAKSGHYMKKALTILSLTEKTNW